MKIDRIQISIKDLIHGYEEKGGDGIEGIIAYSGKLDVRPPYQREYVYAPKERDEVIRTVKKGFPLNTMYWKKTIMDSMSLWMDSNALFRFVDMLQKASAHLLLMKNTTLIWKKI